MKNARDIQNSLRPAGEVEQRTNRYRPSEEIERALMELNPHLAEIPWSFPNDPPSEPTKPILFLIGLQRSGTTLMMQLLNQCFSVCCPDSIIARTFRAPWIGVLLSRSIRRQVRSTGDSSLCSDYGVAESVFDPHEFGFFWTHWFGFDPAHELTADQLAAVDVQGLRESLGRMEAAAGQPLAFKTVPLSFNADFLAEVLPTARFLHLHRDPLYVAQSTWQARLDRYGSEAVWWSLRPGNVAELQSLPPAGQVAAQVAVSRRRIDAAVAKIPSQRVMTLDYERLCEQPAKAIEQLAAFMGNALPQTNIAPPKTLPNRNVRKIEESIFNELKEHLACWQTRAAGRK